MSTKIDFSQVKELAPVDPDTYPVTFTGFEIKTGPKAKFIAAEFTITDEDSDFNGRKVYRNLSLSPNSLWAVKQFLLSAGADAEELEGEMELEEILQELVGNELEVVTTLQEYDGQMRAQVSKIRASSF